MILEDDVLKDWAVTYSFFQLWIMFNIWIVRIASHIHSKENICVLLEIFKKEYKSDTVMLRISNLLYFKSTHRQQLSRYTEYLVNCFELKLT